MGHHQAGDDSGSVYVFDTENVEGINLPLSVEPRGDLRTDDVRGISSEQRYFKTSPTRLNPETWIPYTLADNADVNVRIYDVEGKLVRKLDIGYQRAGSYLNREKAVYWDGRDQLGESVSSGIYFYTLKADAFSIPAEWLS